MNRTTIEWCRSDDGAGGYTWNPIRGTTGKWACVRISTGCENCYAERMNVRFGGPRYQVGVDTPRLDELELLAPTKVKGPARVFVCSMSDLFWDQVTPLWQSVIFDTMAANPQLTFQVLTKRPDRAATFAQMWLQQHALTELPPNIWMGVTAENQATANERIPILLKMAAAIRFVSLEPLLGPIDLTHLDPVNGYGHAWSNALNGTRFQVSPGGSVYQPLPSKLSWVITGGESGGPDDRRLVTHLGNRDSGEMWTPKREALNWVRDIRDACNQAGVAYLHKQWGGPTSKSSGRLLDGREELAWPAEREVPHA